ncbi:MAG TPA: cellulase family glycosylhydrolase [Ktedonobacteraceae bacterium]
MRELEEDPGQSGNMAAWMRPSRRQLLYTGMLGGLALGSMYLAGCSTSAVLSVQDPATPAASFTRSTFQVQSESASLSAQGWPGPILPAGLGVNLHFNSTTQALNQIPRLAGLGLRFVRLDLTWSVVEHQRGHYDFSSYDPIFRALTAHGIRALCILGYTNALYEAVPSPPSSAVGPHTDTVRQAFARFAGATAAHYKGRGMIWEIWNEPDNVRFWSPTPSASAYMALVKATVPALRKADASALIIAPALTGMSSQYPAAWTYLENCFSLGLPGLVDAISAHPYRQSIPESVTADYQRLRSLIVRYAPRNKASMPIINSEWGYSGTWVSRSQQAAYVTRLFLIDILNGLPLSIWYDWQDDGNDSRQQEDNFGLLTWNNQQKPAYAAAQTLIRELGGYRFSRRLISGSDYGLLFSNGETQKQVIWTTSNPHALTLSIKASSVTITSLTGGKRTQPVIGGKTALQITGDPQYVTPGV